MNLESNSSKKPTVIVASDDFDFDFKPINSGLGFHNNKTTEIKPVFSESQAAGINHISVPTPSPRVMPRKENQIYQNELSVFYGRETLTQAPVENVRAEKVVRRATKSQRVLAYVLDLGLVLSAVAVVLTIMSRLIEKDLMEVWSSYPNEITPLVLVLFAGFYMMYFSIFEKTSQSTLGKNLLGVTVVDLDNKSQSFTMLMFRSFVSLMNFVSLGLFSYFDLQNKVSNTKVIRVD
jgi:uncharacterized RDD family membrane protein YckC